MNLIKLRAGRFMVSATITDLGDKYELKFPYNKELLKEVKMMSGRRWVPEKKAWTIKKNSHNEFALAYLMGKNPYAPYDTELEVPDLGVRYNRLARKDCKIYQHQAIMFAHIKTRRYAGIAGEMGTGKTLPVLLFIEELAKEDPGCDIFYVAPKATLKAIELEFFAWGVSTKNVKFYTYEKLKTVVTTWPSGKKAPRCVVFDESSRIKNPVAQRSVAAFHIAESVREDWGDDGCVICMSGTPAPKSPVDWWHQAEVVRPGFLKEGDVHLFKSTLAILAESEGMAGGSFLRIVAWRKDENLCEKCGEHKTNEVHGTDAIFDGWGHGFEPSVNEVERLYKRLKGLYYVVFKKDCIDLPDKQYRKIQCTPPAAMLRAAKMIAVKFPRAATALIMLRELSDGFQYESIDTEEELTCKACHGTGKVINYYNQETDTYSILKTKETDAEMVFDCENCSGTGKVFREEKVPQRVPTPKDDVLKELLDEYSDVGRVVIYAGFTASIDRCVEIAAKQGWHVIRVDGRGWQVFGQDGKTFPAKDALRYFQSEQEEFPNVAFVGHPASAGMGLTLTASPVIIRYSNVFDAEAHIQAEDRIHRPGMDPNRGATIIDILNLPTDEKILQNLALKRELQAISMGEIKSAFESEIVER